MKAWASNVVSPGSGVLGSPVPASTTSRSIPELLRLANHLRCIAQLQDGARSVVSFVFSRFAGVTGVSIVFSSSVFCAILTVQSKRLRIKLPNDHRTHITVFGGQSLEGPVTDLRILPVGSPVNHKDHRSTMEGLVVPRRGPVRCLNRCLYGVSRFLTIKRHRFRVHVRSQNHTSTHSWGDKLFPLPLTSKAMYG